MITHSCEEQCRYELIGDVELRVGAGGELVKTEILPFTPAPDPAEETGVVSTGRAEGLEVKKRRQQVHL